MAKNSTDKIVLLKIKKYINHLSRVYYSIKELSDEELEDELYAYAAAQLITNLKESYDMLKNELLQDRYKLLRQPSIVRIRNIASHDYEALNWNIVKSGCAKIVETYNTEAYHEDSLNILNEVNLSDIELELSKQLQEVNDPNEFSISKNFS